MSDHDPIQGEMKRQGQAMESGRARTTPPPGAHLRDFWREKISIFITPANFERSSVHTKKLGNIE
jgi:hypothetical protein